MIEIAHSFLASSPHLVNRLSTSGKPTRLLSHGVDVGLFSSIAAVEHPVLRDIPGPRIGYFGLFDERSDQQLIADVAKSMPDTSFVIAGRVEAGTSRLSRLSNVYFVGNIAYHDLPKFVKGVDVLFLPYIVNALSDALSPLKFKEYIATGKPVISTPIAAAHEFSDLIAIAASSDEWTASLTDQVGKGNAISRDLIDACLRGESWAEKAVQMMSVCESRKS